METIGRKNSYLEFLKYAPKIDTINDILNADLEKSQLIESNEEEKNIKDELDAMGMDTNYNLVHDGNLSLGDIKFLPDEIKQNQVILMNTMTLENNKKNIEANTLIKMIRDSTFDRQSVNTNVMLTQKELTRYYKRTKKN